MWSVTGLLDQRRIDVDTALELVRAGPAARTLVLARPDGARAGNAPDGRIAPIVQRVVRNLVDVDVGVDALGVPVGERLDLENAVAIAPLDLLRTDSRRALLAPDARDPRVVAGERSFERLDLADVAAAVGVGLPEAVDRIDGSERAKLQAVALDEPVAGLVRLREEHLRVELDDVDVEPELGDHVHEHGALALPGAGEAHPAAELGVRPAEDVLGGHGLEVEVRECRRARHRAAPPSACPRATRAGASRAGSPRPAGCCRGSLPARTASRTTPAIPSSAPRR